MSRKRGTPGEVVGLKVEYHDRRDPAALATQVAQHIQASVSLENDAAAFARRANVDRNKAAELRSLIEQVKRRKAGERPAKVSRMDPLDSYDPIALETQAAQHDRQAADFDQRARECTGQAQQERKKAEKLQVEIHEINERQRQQSADS